MVIFEIIWHRTAHDVWRRTRRTHTS